MKPHEILSSKEFYEPETLRTLFPQLSEEEAEQLQVLQVLTTNQAFWQDLFIFENAVLALNEIKPEAGFMQGCTPSQIWYAVSLVSRIAPERKYDYEIKQYVKFMSNQHGTFIYPPEMFEDSENSLYDRAKFLASGKKPLNENTSVEIQAGHYAAIQLYIRMKQDDELLALNQSKKKEAYYAIEPNVEPGSGQDQLVTKTANLVIPFDDTYINEAQSGTNYSTSTSMIVQETIMSALLASLIKPDLSNLDTTLLHFTIQSAILTLQCTSQMGNMVVEAHAVAEDWLIDEVTWSNKTTLTPWAGAHYITNAVDSITITTTGEYILNVTTLIQNQIAGTGYGIYLRRAVPGVPSRAEFATEDNATASLHPTLVITYTFS